MITYNQVVDAISMCAAYDPMHAPRKSEVMVSAWLDHFQSYPNISPERLQEAVRTYYKTPSRPFPQPADISSIARAAIRDDDERSPLPELMSAPASPEHREKCLAEIKRIIERQGRRWSVPRAE